MCVWTACVPRTCAGWDAASSFPRQGFRPTAPPLTQQTLGVPVVAVGVPTVMEADTMLGAKRSLVVTPKDIDAIIRRGATLLALAINKALQPALSVGELTFLTS